MTTGDAGAPAASSPLDVLITRLDPALPLPGYARPGDAGADLFAAEDVDLAPGATRPVEHKPTPNQQIVHISSPSPPKGERAG